MPSTSAIVLKKEKISIVRGKGLPNTERIDLIVMPEGQTKACRFQVRKDKYSLLENINVKDFILIHFIMEFNEVLRSGENRRFDNNILIGLEKC
ncbi:hypothetical protein BTO06_09965 [Tenacibaculum sp. SZ-18]|uniref:hypothetical protein n=1 Tax=Tenacibaculum sp. SZ-18 TaxID=754423 RepID=UPI000C2D3EFE|nr:hypothetical protein [Tenacibaculum sp. SZ-18]AUC15446.1 hypothetical protein BTO06_09965 [Tenacibaculum sp. SZ-18]